MKTLSAPYSLVYVWHLTHTPVKPLQKVSEVLFYNITIYEDTFCTVLSHVGMVPHTYTWQASAESVRSSIL